MRRPDDVILDEVEIERLASEHALAAGYREAARRALGFARRYRMEEGTAGGSREQACIAQAQLWRRAVRDLHAGLAIPSAPDGMGPGVARARPDPGQADGRKTG